ncbi:class I SAM-dependent methyltransferase [Chondromyces crocatus]|uniref:Methyltransferase n=1 Tax=Chondromyces crocatus TaxID=52 RepID=A0A0K1EJ86_CHOCO|nr:class I SAM-dependent methyltransferase [Chondromyces crocatus]AKT40936.1 methyltransferase [Chondromyces crocatus]
MRVPRHFLAALLTTAITTIAACTPTGRPEPPLVDAAPPATTTTAEPTVSTPATAPARVEQVTITPAVRAAVDAADRSATDRALDPGRHPAETLSFLGITPSAKVAELGAGGGYTAELLARIVGPSGTVYGQNSAFILERFAEAPWSERLTKPLMKPVVRVDRPFDDPLPPEAKELDAVLMLFFYHDTFWMGVDRDAMNRAVFRALKPGGVYGILDHSGRPGTGTSEVKTLHRIEEQVVREEIERAGFKLAAEATFLRNPDDPRDWNASPSAAGEKRGQSDRFVLKFVKP